MPIPYKRTSEGKSLMPPQIFPKLFLWALLSLMDPFQLKFWGADNFEVFGQGGGETAYGRSVRARQISLKFVL